MAVSSLNILVCGALMDSQAAFSALQFCRAAVAKGINIEQVFFYQGGVFVANRYNEPLGDEFNALQSWVEFSQQNDTELRVCVSAAERRGVVGKNHDGINESNLHESFSVAGLATFFDACAAADRTVTFK